MVERIGDVHGMDMFHLRSSSPKVLLNALKKLPRPLIRCWGIWEWKQQFHIHPWTSMLYLVWQTHCQVSNIYDQHFRVLSIFTPREKGQCTPILEIFRKRLT